VQVLFVVEYVPQPHFEQVADFAFEYSPGAQSISFSLPAGHFVPQAQPVAVHVASLGQ
jgi:hypothetical protein